MRRMVLASRNPHKIGELRDILAKLGVEMKSALDFPELEEVEEDRSDLEGNALKKARYVFEKTGFPALADDTGLELDALGGQPGVFSSRYAGEGASYRDNVEKLLSELDRLAGADRRARFRTVVAFVDGEGEEHIFEGICKGVILEKPAGDKGFGYDPVFKPEGQTRSFAQLDPAEKNRISHRGIAIREFCRWLEER